MAGGNDMSMQLMVHAMKVPVGNPLTKLVLLKLADNANDEGLCWPKYQTIADECEIGRSTVKTHIKKLADAGFLWIEKRNNGKSSNYYHLTLDKGTPTSRKIHPRPGPRGSGADRVSSEPGQEKTLRGAGADRPGGQELTPEPVIEPVNESVTPPVVPRGTKNSNLDSLKPSDQQPSEQGSSGQSKPMGDSPPPPDSSPHRDPPDQYGQMAELDPDDRKDLELAEWIYRRVTQVAPFAKPPNWGKWRDVLRKMRTIDGIERSMIAAVFDWANRDDFWKTNILSPSKLRQQFATLQAKANAQAVGNSSSDRQKLRRSLRNLNDLEW